MTGQTQTPIPPKNYPYSRSCISVTKKCENVWADEVFLKISLPVERFQIPDSIGPRNGHRNKAMARGRQERRGPRMVAPANLDQAVSSKISSMPWDARLQALSTSYCAK